MRRGLWIAVLTAGLVTAACDAVALVAQDSGDVDVGGVWTVARVGDVPAVASQEPRVEFLADGRTIRVVAKACSEKTADVAITEGTIRVGELRATSLLPCGGDLREFDGLVHQALSGATTIAGSRGRLMIGGGQGDLLLVRQDIEPTAAERGLVQALLAPEWRYVAGPVQPHPDLPPIRFRGGTFEAVGVCGFAGEWRYRGEDLVNIPSISWGNAVGCLEAGQLARFRLSEALAAVEQVDIDAEETRLVLRGRGVELTFAAESP